MSHCSMMYRFRVYILSIPPTGLSRSTSSHDSTCHAILSCYEVITHRHNIAVQDSVLQGDESEIDLKSA